jgi:cyclic beta-1,2-glucan synthetase
LESILGFKVEGNVLRMEPCVPSAWPRYEIHFKHRSATYEIVVENPRRVSSGVAEVRVDGKKVEGPSPLIPLEDDGRSHSVLVVMG